MDMIASKIEERLASLAKRIEKLEQSPAPIGVEAIAERNAEEDDIMRQIHLLMKLAIQAGDVFFRTVQKKLQSLEARLTLLPSTPPIEVIQLAQGILPLDPLILVTDDSLHNERHPVLTRILLMDLTGTPCFDYQFPSPSNKNTLQLAINEGTADIDGHPPLISSPLEQEWAHLQNMLQGRYVVTFDQSLVQTQLAVTAWEYGLPVPMLIGHSLLDLLLKYTRVKKLIDKSFDEDDPSFPDALLCSLLAEEDVAPFIDLASGSADQRALHLLHTLQTMANGTLSLLEPLPVSTLMQFPDPSLEKGSSPL